MASVRQYIKEDLFSTKLTPKGTYTTYPTNPKFLYTIFYSLGMLFFVTSSLLRHHHHQ